MGFLFCVNLQDYIHGAWFPSSHQVDLQNTFLSLLWTSSTNVLMWRLRKVSSENCQIRGLICEAMEYSIGVCELRE